MQVGGSPVLYVFFGQAPNNIKFDKKLVLIRHSISPYRIHVSGQADQTPENILTLTSEDTLLQIYWSCLLEVSESDRIFSRPNCKILKVMLS